MQTILNTPDDPAHDSLVEKKSEFIGDAAHVDTLDEALAFVAAIREQHPKARHVVTEAVSVCEMHCTNTRAEPGPSEQGPARK